MRTNKQLQTKPNWALLQDVQVSPHLKPLHADPRWAGFLATLKSNVWSAEGDERSP